MTTHCYGRIAWSYLQTKRSNPTLIQVVKSATIREFILTRGTKSKFLAPSSGAGPLNYDYCTYGTFGGTDSHHPHGLGRQFDNLWKCHELAKALKLSLSLSLSLISAHLHLGSSQVKRLALRNPARSWKLWFAYIAVPEDWIKEQNQRQQIWAPGGQVFTLFLSKNVHSFLFFWFLAPLMFIHTYMFCFCRNFFPANNWPISVLFSGTRTGILISPQL